MAEELRELRLSKQIPAKDMVAVVQAIYPKYDKTVQSKCENGDAYGQTRWRRSTRTSRRS